MQYKYFLTAALVALAMILGFFMWAISVLQYDNPELLGLIIEMFRGIGGGFGGGALAVILINRANVNVKMNTREDEMRPENN